MVHQEKVFVSNDGTATISCPHCGITKQIPVERYRNKKHTVKIRCGCSESFIVQLEFRRNWRKRTELLGTYSIKSGGGGSATIINLSKNGVGFSVSGLHRIQAGQKGSIDFVLDNRKSTRISKEIVIRSVDGNRIGCEFVANQPFEKDLGFYLQP